MPKRSKLSSFESKSAGGSATASPFQDIEEMPRKPSNRRRILKYQPLAFSPFMRSLMFAAAASACTSSHKMSPPVADKKPEKMAFDDGRAKQQPLKERKEHSESSDEEEVKGVVQADFEFFDPKPEDFHGVKILLQNYLDDKEWDLSGFVDLILGQTTVGTVVKVVDDDDDGLFSVVSALNLGRYKDHKCMKDLKEFLLKMCLEKNVMGDLKSLFGERVQDVGLLVSQRVVNLPPQLLPPLYDALFDEISWATEDEPTEELQNSFCFKSYLLVTKIYKLKNVQQRRNSRSDVDEEVIFIKPEDELFLQLSAWSFTFPLNTQLVTAQELRNYRLMGLVMAVEADKIAEFRQQLKSLIDEP